MDVILQVLARYQLPLYALLLVLGLRYWQRYGRARRALAGTLFGLEKEHAKALQARAVGMLLLLLTTAAAIGLAGISAGFVAPEGGTAPGVTPIFGTLAPIDFPTPTAALPTPDGTPSSKSQPTDVPSGPLALQVDDTGCLNPDATLTHPRSDARLSGSVDVMGTADVLDFASYKLEVAGHATAGTWTTVGFSDTAVRDGSLGVWDTTAFAPGLYALRLVVFDQQGRLPLPCVVAVEVLATTQPLEDEIAVES